MLFASSASDTPVAACTCIHYTGTRHVSGISTAPSALNISHRPTGTKRIQSAARLSLCCQSQLMELTHQPREKDDCRKHRCHSIVKRSLLNPLTAYRSSLEPPHTRKTCTRSHMYALSWPLLATLCNPDVISDISSLCVNQEILHNKALNHNHNHGLGLRQLPIC